MADIELVIKIDEELYNYMQTEEYVKHLDKRFDYQIRFAVKKGTPLPKGHGRLIDADELEECKEMMNTISGESKYVVRMDDIRNMPTIIEADKESEE